MNCYRNINCINWSSNESPTRQSNGLPQKRGALRFIEPYISPRKRMEFVDDALKQFGEVVPFGEEAFMVLRAHLIAEHHLFAYVRSRVVDPEFMKEVESRYSPVGSGLGLILLAQALSLRDEVPPACNDVLWPALKALNELRNRLAHELHPDQDGLVKKMKKFIQLSLGESVPSGGNLNQLFYACAQMIVAYLAIDRQPFTVADTQPFPE